MTIEGVVFYGSIIDDDDSVWISLLEEYEYANEQMLVDYFHSDLLQDKKWKTWLERDTSKRHVLAKKYSPEEIYGGCRINLFGDNRDDPTRYYIAIAETEVMGRWEGSEVTGRILEKGKRREWNSRIRQFCKQLGIRYTKADWQLVFWWC